MFKSIIIRFSENIFTVLSLSKLINLKSFLKSLNLLKKDFKT